MKAKDYAAMIDVSTDKAILQSATDMAGRFRNETVDLMRKRGDQTITIDSAVGVLNEQDLKWIAVCHILETKCGQKVLKKTGFREMIREITPFCLTFWTPAPVRED
jgi:hypothetical protein